jgi:hypothetical protein
MGAIAGGVAGAVVSAVLAQYVREGRTRALRVEAVPAERGEDESEDR